MSNNITITGEVAFAMLVTPDTQVFNGKPQSRYKLSLIIDADKFSSLKSHLGKRFNIPNMDVMKIAHKINEDGRVTLYLAIKSTNKFGGSNKPPLLDSVGGELTSLLGRGSKVAVQVEPFPYSINGKNGIALWPKSVQVVELKEVPKSQSYGVPELGQPSSNLNTRSTGGINISSGDELPSF